jgi:hypothetical protein
MPIVARFRGTVEAMFYDDHPPPHFHASHGEHEAVVSLSGELIDGRLPFHALRDVRHWARQNASELENNWDRARATLPLVRIRGPR